MSGSEFVLCEVDDKGIATITLNRPEKHNAFNAEMIQSLTECFISLKKDTSLRALWLKSNGKHFCAGADIAWLKSSINLSHDESQEDALKLGAMMYHLYHMDIPTIASVQGACFGGGTGLIACCKIVIASSDSKYCFSETKLGIVPAVISPYLIAAMGARTAESYFLTTEVFDANRARDLRLCYDIVEQAYLEARSKEILQIILRNGPKASKGIRHLVNTVLQQPINESLLAKTAKIIADFRASEEGQEGLNAFLEKRQPNWVIEL